MKKQTAKAQTIMNNLRNPETKSKIFYLSDIFKAVNELNLQLQGRKSDFVSCSQKIKGFMGKLKFWKKQVAKKEPIYLQKLLQHQSNIGVHSSM